MAYHVGVHALEARAGISPLGRFWLAVGHSLDAHLPYARLHAAGIRRARDKASSSDIERSVADWLRTDLCPAVQSGRLAISVEGWIRAYNAYNQSGPRVVRTQAELVSDSGTVPTYVVRRELLDTKVDPEPCKVSTFAILEVLFNSAAARSRTGTAGTMLTVSGVARSVGAQHSAAAEVAEVFENRGAVSIPELAKQLGSGQRTLERKLRSEGGSAETIRLSVRMTRATELLASALTLTEIAHVTGFSDSAHMARAFKRACGIAPSVLKQSIHDGGGTANSRSSIR